MNASTNTTVPIEDVLALIATTVPDLDDRGLMVLLSALEHERSARPLRNGHRGPSSAGVSISVSSGPTSPAPTAH
jgi:hypothetical protein